jgi:hypothetical protein
MLCDTLKGTFARCSLPLSLIGVASVHSIILSWTDAALHVPPQKLTQPLPIRGGLRTIGEAANYVLELPHAESCNRWRRAAELLLDQADVATVSKQVKLALFYDAQLDLKAME